MVEGDVVHITMRVDFLRSLRVRSRLRGHLLALLDDTTLADARLVVGPQRTEYVSQPLK